MLTDRHTDMTTPVVVFRYFVKAPEKRVDHPRRISDGTEITVIWKQFFCQYDFHPNSKCTPGVYTYSAQGRCGKIIFFFWWHLIFVGTGYGFCFMSPFWSPEFWGGCTRFVGNLYIPDADSCIPSIKVLLFVIYTFEIFMVVVIHRSSSAAPGQPLAKPNGVATPVLPTPAVWHRSIQP